MSCSIIFDFEVCHSRIIESSLFVSHLCYVVNILNKTFYVCSKIFAKFYVWFDCKKIFFIHLWKAKPNHTSPSNDQENSIVCNNIPGKIPTREMNWLLLALLLLLYYCVSHESFPFFHSCLSLIFILLLFFCCCVNVNVYMCYLHILFILCPKSCVRSFFFPLFSYIFMFLNNKWWTYWFRIYWFYMLRYNLDRTNDNNMKKRVLHNNMGFMLLLLFILNMLNVVTNNK